MYDLSYFNLGFRSDSVSNLLQSLQEKERPELEVLDDAFRIIADCLNIKERSSLVQSFSLKQGYQVSTLLPILAELFTDKNVSDIIDELKALHKTLEKVKKDRNAANNSEYKHAISFFSRLADLCLSNSAHQVSSENYALI